MKLLKSLAVIGLSSLLAVTTAQAAEKNNAQQTTTKKRDVALERFNQNVGLRLVQRGINIAENNQPQVVLTYVVQNKGKNKIKSVEWVSGYTLNNEVFYVHNIPLTFKPALDAGKQIDVTIAIPAAQLPENAQKIFSDRNAAVDAVNGAKNVVFSNGKRIVVSK